MKRMIICMDCCGRFDPDKTTEGEFMKVVFGVAKDVYNCDMCNAIVGVGQQCSAVSIWTLLTRIPYYPWEPEYITVSENRKNDEG